MCSITYGIAKLLNLRFAYVIEQQNGRQINFALALEVYSSTMYSKIMYIISVVHLDSL